MKKVLLFLSHGFEELEAAAFTDVFGWSRDCGLEGVGLETAAIRPKIKGTWNLTVIPEVQLSDIDLADYDALAIPGGFEEAGYYEDAYSVQFLDTVRAFNAAGKPIAAICVGALPVGKSGIMEGRKGTTYHLEKSIRLDQLSTFGVKTETAHMVVDDNVITSCGPSSATDVAFALLEKLTDRDNANTVRRAMGFPEQ